MTTAGFVGRTMQHRTTMLEIFKDNLPYSWSELYIK